MLRLALLLALALLPAAGLATSQEPLPTDPALVSGTLDNGLAYLVRRHANPPGRLAVWLHVASGSLNETEDTRGLAHYLEHMAFNGSANFPPGSLIPFFQSLGMAFGRDQNAFTGFDQTTYTLALPDTKPETLDRGLLYLSDVALRLSLLPAEIDNERQIIVEEKRARAGAEQRIREYVYERLAPESTFGRRLPIGTEQTIRSLSPPDFRDYYRRWYVPSNMTVIAVGDADPTLVVDTIRKHFAGGPTVPRPADRDAGVRPQTATRAIVASDAELTRGEVSILRVEPPGATVTTVPAFRRDLVEALGSTTFNRRMTALLAEGKVSFLEAGTSAREQARAIRLVSATAAGRPEAWRAMLAELATELQRARLHGFADQEVRDAGATMLARAEETAQQDATLPARTLLRRLNGAVTRREPAMSAAQRLDLLRRLLPGITAAEVSAAFAVTFDPTHVTFIVELPSGPDVPTEAELVALGGAAVAVRPDPPATAARVTALLDTLPAPGTVVESTEHAPTGVWSAWLDNGVRVHHRLMTDRRNEASVVITLAGGAIQETAASRGVTEAAALAWERPAARSRTSIQIRDLMTGKRVRLSAKVGRDAITLTVAGDPAELEAGLQLAHLLLTEPRIEPAAFAQWKDAETQEIQGRKVQPAGLLSEAIAEAFYPADEPRTRLLEVADLQRITLAAAQAWLTRLCAEAPIEVAVVGDIDRPTAGALVARYLGALPARDRIGDKTLGHLRSIRRPTGPLGVERTIPVRTPQAVVMVGAFGTDIQNVPDVRGLAMATRVLSTRMNRTIREERQLVYSIGAISRPAAEYPGFGVVVAQAPTDPTKAAALAQAVEELFQAFAQDGPTDDELAVARKQMANQLDELLRQPDFWSGRLASLDYRGLRLDDTVAAPAAYQRLTAAEIREAFARYWRPEGRFRFVLRPGP